MPPNRVHLGTLELRTDPDAAGPSAVLPDDAWSPLDITFLEDGTWEPDEGDKIDVLSRCLTDLSLDAACDFQRRGSSVFVRVAIQPNDYHLWKLSKARSKLLFQLFGLLHRFWNGGGEKIIRDSVGSMPPVRSYAYVLGRGARYRHPGRVRLARLAARTALRGRRVSGRS
jgi:hypothetical protein